MHIRPSFLPCRETFLVSDAADDMACYTNCIVLDSTSQPCGNVTLAYQLGFISTQARRCRSHTEAYGYQGFCRQPTLHFQIHHDSIECTSSDNTETSIMTITDMNIAYCAQSVTVSYAFVGSSKAYRYIHPWHVKTALRFSVMRRYLVQLTQSRSIETAIDTVIFLRFAKH
jgi:hypothetical protein